MKVSLGGKLVEMKPSTVCKPFSLFSRYLRGHVGPSKYKGVQRDFARGVIKSVDLQHPTITRCVCLRRVGVGASEHSVVLDKIKQRKQRVVVSRSGGLLG